MVDLPAREVRARRPASPCDLRPPSARTRPCACPRAPVLHSLRLLGCSCWTTPPTTSLSKVRAAETVGRGSYDRLRVARPPVRARRCARRRTGRACSTRPRRPVPARARRGAQQGRRALARPAAQPRPRRAQHGDGVCANVEFPSYTTTARRDGRRGRRGVRERGRGVGARACRLAAARGDRRVRARASRGAPRWLPTSAARRAAARPPVRGRRQAGRDSSTATAARARHIDHRLARRPRRAGRRLAAARRPALAGRAVAPAARRTIGTPAPAELLDDGLPRELPPGPAFSIFGATRIAPVARARCCARWPSSATCTCGCTTRHRRCGRAVARASGPARARDNRRRSANPLLASHVARRARAAAAARRRSPHDDVHHPIADPPGHAARPAAGRAGRRPAAVPGRARRRRPQRAGARRARPGPAGRGLREVVLGLLAADPTLEPRDIVIMCPDVETFAPLIAASLRHGRRTGRPPGGEAAGAAGRPVAAPDQSAAAAARPAARARRGPGHAPPQLLDLAGAAPVRRRFGFDDDDLERLRELDGRGRRALGPRRRAPRAATGSARSSRAPGARRSTGCCSAWRWRTTARGSAHDAAARRRRQRRHRPGRPLRRTRRPRRRRGPDALSTRRPARAWTALLDGAGPVLGEGDRAVAGAAAAPRARRGGRERRRRPTSSSGWPTSRALLGDRLAGRPTRASFRTGTLTVCTLVPMRSVPHRVVCLLGMDDGAFPRQGIADGDDVLAREPAQRRARPAQRGPPAVPRRDLRRAGAPRHHLHRRRPAQRRRRAAVRPARRTARRARRDRASARTGGPARDHVVVRAPVAALRPRATSARRARHARGRSRFDPSALAGARAAAARPRRRRRPGRPRALPPAPRPSDVVDSTTWSGSCSTRPRASCGSGSSIAHRADDDDPADALPVELDGLAGVGHRRPGAAPLPGRHEPRRTRGAAGVPARRAAARPARPARHARRRRAASTRCSRACDDRARSDRPTSLDVAVALGDGRVAGRHGRRRARRRRSSTSPTRALAAKHRLAAWVRLARRSSPRPVTRELRAVTVGRSRDDARPVGVRRRDARRSRSAARPARQAARRRAARAAAAGARDLARVRARPRAG